LIRKKPQKGEIPEGLLPQAGIAGEGPEIFFRSKLVELGRNGGTKVDAGIEDEGRFLKCEQEVAEIAERNPRSDLQSEV
jgi:hypothetical protein